MPSESSGNCLISVNSFVLVCSLILFMVSGWVTIKDIYDNKYIKKTSVDLITLQFGLTALFNLCILIYSYTNRSTCELGTLLKIMAFIVLLELVAFAGAALM